MSDDYKIIFGKNLRHVREGRRLTQQNVADAISTQQPAYSRIEKGETNVTLKTIFKLSEALDVPPSAFFENTDDDRR